MANIETLRISDEAFLSSNTVVPTWHEPIGEVLQTIPVASPQSAIEQAIYNASDREKEVGELEGVRMVIPRRHLFGIKEKSEYKDDKRKRLEEAFSEREDPASLLQESPVIACALTNPENNQTFLAVVNGHHRVRISSKYDIHDIPCEVFTPDQFAAIVNTDEKRTHDVDYTAESLSHDLSQWMIDAAYSFGQTMPDYKQPIPVADVSSMTDLQARFPAF